MLLLTIITIPEAKRDSLRLFIIVLIIVCISKYTNIHNIEPLHCAGGSMDLNIADLNLADNSKEIVNEVSSTTSQAVITETLPNTIRSTAEDGSLIKSTRLYDLPKKDLPMWAKGAIDGVCGCAVPKTGPIHCTCNHDLVRTLCWTHMENMRCCKHSLGLPDYECAKCYCVFHQECLPPGYTVLKDSSEEWWRTLLRRGLSTREKLNFYDKNLHLKSMVQLMMIIICKKVIIMKILDMVLLQLAMNQHLEQCLLIVLN